MEEETLENILFDYFVDGCVITKTKIIAIGKMYAQRHIQRGNCEQKFDVEWLHRFLLGHPHLNIALDFSFDESGAEANVELPIQVRLVSISKKL